MSQFPLASRRGQLKSYGRVGRVLDRDIYGESSLSENPDPVDSTSSGERYFDASLNWAVKSGLKFLDISNLFVSAAGLDPNENGAYFPPQLIYTQKQGQDEEQWKALATQYDEDFDGGFPAILKSLHQPAMIYGRAIGEIDWQRDGSRIGARFIWSRDPEEYLIDPPGYRKGIYQKKSLYATADTGNITRMPDGKFLLFSYDPLFNNPYGTSLIRPILKEIEAWEEFYNAWRKAVKNAGYGMWIGRYGPTLKGKANVTARNDLYDEMEKLISGNRALFDKDLDITSEQLSIQEKALLDYHDAFVEMVSVLFTGNATALKEGKYGTYADAESTGAREKSKNEQLGASLMGQVFTSQFNRHFLNLNFENVKAVPQLQLIRPELITPTTPADQQTQDDSIQVAESGKPDKDPSGTKALAEFAAADEPDETTQAQFETFPDTKPDPDITREDIVREGAKAYLESLPVKNYADVTPKEAPDVFTAKRLRNYEGAVGLLERLKSALIDTIDLPTEADAWNAYIIQAKSIFQELGLDLSSSLQADLIISFRQARQSALQAGLDALIEQEGSNVTGIETVTMGDGRSRPVHVAWHGVVLAPDDPRRTKVKKPMDFGCRCFDIPVLNNEKPLTPESDIPEVFPGESYRGYVA